MDLRWLQVHPRLGLRISRCRCCCAATSCGCECPCRHSHDIGLILAGIASLLFTTGLTSPPPGFTSLILGVIITTPRHLYITLRQLVAHLLTLAAAYHTIGWMVLVCHPQTYAAEPIHNTVNLQLLHLQTHLLDFHWVSCNVVRAPLLPGRRVQSKK